MNFEIINELCDTVLKVDKVVRENKMKTPGTMNIVEIMNRHHLENQHSNVLSFLIDSNEKHNHPEYGEAFLTLLRAKGLKTKGVRVVSVKREGSTDESRRMDLLIESDADFIIIENKIHAGDQINQIADYVSFMDYRSGSSDRVFVVYLTVWGNKPSEQSISKENLLELQKKNRFITLSYSQDILGWLESLKTTEQETVLQSAINQYIDVIRGLTNKRQEFFNMGKEISKELLKEYGNLSHDQLREKMLALYEFQQNINLTLYVNFFSDMYKEANGRLSLFCNNKYDYKDLDEWKNDVSDSQQKFGVRYHEGNFTKDFFVQDLSSNTIIVACIGGKLDAEWGNDVRIDGYDSAKQLTSWVSDAIHFYAKADSWGKGGNPKLSTHMVNGLCCIEQ